MQADDTPAADPAPAAVEPDNSTVSTAADAAPTTNAAENPDESATATAAAAVAAAGTGAADQKALHPSIINFLFP